MTGIVSVYGQTESSPGSTMSAWTDPLDLRCETVGYAFPHVQCKVIDPETGEEVPTGVNGEFCAKVLAYILISWIRSGMQVPPEEMVEIYYFMTTHSMKDLPEEL